MKGDFSRFIYDERKNYSLLLTQQGRVQLDSDWNEQALLHWFGLQNLARDLIGEHGGPRNDFGFEITPAETGGGTTAKLDFNIGRGRYYLQGEMCRNMDSIRCTEQEAWPFPDTPPVMENGKKYLIYLHLWWRHITSLEDDQIREVALGGPDTTTRLQTVWQVKAVEIRSAVTAVPNLKTNYEEFARILAEHHIFANGTYRKVTGRLKARALKPPKQDQPCITSPQNRYRGAENQLYRVEIHRAGTACGVNESAPDYPCATFKWSRENGSVVFPIVELNEEKVTLEHLGRDDRFGLKVGEWVEMVDDHYELQRRAEQLFKVVEIDPDRREVTLSDRPHYPLGLSRHPLLRRWDHAGQKQHQGAIPVTEGEWIELEDGIQIQFTSGENQENEPSWYQTGSWWWIPARNITGDVEWPQENGQPSARRALDAGDRYAPLALLDPDSGNIIDYRRKFKKLWE